MAPKIDRPKHLYVVIGKGHVYTMARYSDAPTNGVLLKANAECVAHVMTKAEAVAAIGRTRRYERRHGYKWNAKDLRLQRVHSLHGSFLRVAHGNPCQLLDCPPGFFLFQGALCFKSEYMTNGHWPEAFCESGEYFWGGTTIHEIRARLMVQPVSVIA